MTAPDLEPFNVKLDGQDLKCPVCHQSILIQISSVLVSSGARITGGDTFQSNVAVGAEVKPVSVHISHTCKIPEKGR